MDLVLLVGSAKQTACQIEKPPSLISHEEKITPQPEFVYLSVLYRVTIVILLQDLTAANFTFVRGGHQLFEKGKKFATPTVTRHIPSKYACHKYW